MRLCIVVEGPTEEGFVRQVLNPHLSALGVYPVARSVETGRSRSRIHRGGVVSYQKLQNDITDWMKEDRNPDVRFTTLIDYYGLRRLNDFPGWDQAHLHTDPYQRVGVLERQLAKAIHGEIDDHRFIPHLQLHEFETLLLVAPDELAREFIGRETEIAQLVEDIRAFDNPELINDDPETAPSKRIIRFLPEYRGAKTSAGPKVAEWIGLASMRARCAHFDRWISELEDLSG